MTRHFSDWISSYVEVVTPKGEAPERFHFWVAAFTIAGVLRRRVYIDEGTFRWFPNMYVVLVGPPGTVKKSTTIGIGARLLRDIPNIHIGADCTTWQDFVKQVGEAKDMFASGDPTVEGGVAHEAISPSLGDDFADSLMNQVQTVTCALNLTISEWGTFIDPEDRQMINVLTELWDCKLDQAFVKSTKTQGSDTLMNPFVNMIAGTTPKWMNDNFRGRFGGWGFSSRCIFLHCKEPERFVAYPHKLWTGKHDEWMTKFREDLLVISHLQGEMRLEPDAEAFGEQWYKAHMQRKISLDNHPNHDPWLSYYLARKFDHAHKLAIVLCASRGSSLRISLRDLQDAIHRTDEVEDELSQIFITRESVNRDAKINMDVWNGLAAIIRNDGGIELWRALAFTTQYLTGGRANELINHLLNARYLRKEVDGHTELLVPGENFDGNAVATAQASEAPLH